MRTCGWYPMKVLCSQGVVSPHRCGVVPCQVTVKASAPPGAMVCPLLVTPEGRSGKYGSVQYIDFYALSCGSFRKQARNLIETAQLKSHPLEGSRQEAILLPYTTLTFSSLRSARHTPPPIGGLR